MLLLVAVAMIAALAVAMPFSAAHKLFGYAEKNGRMPPSNTGELLVFNHSCTTAPCVVTQVHVPSIYPGSGCPWDWESGVLRLYIDGEEVPSIVMTLLQLASVGAAGAQGNSHRDISPFAAGHLFGKNAQTGTSIYRCGVSRVPARPFACSAPPVPYALSLAGGVWTTMRIPFGQSLRVTLQQAAECNSESTYWFIIRGVEGLGVTLGEIDLPPAARLGQAVISNTTFAQNAFIPLASASATDDGMLLYTFIDATSADPNYLEGCFHMTFGDKTEQFLSSGTEDYFLSASYFDEGTFADSQAGYVFAGAGGSKSMYKLHDSRDLIPFHGGMQFVWRNNEDGASCPNHFASTPQRRLSRSGPMTLTSIVFFYHWPAAAST